MREWKGYNHGINLGGWFSQCDHSEDRYDNFITEDDIKKISEWGLDHVRLPIDYNLIAYDNGDIKTNGFNYLDCALLWCERHNLNMIIDLHKTFGYSFDAGEKEDGFFERSDYQQRFYRLWEEIARRYGNRGEGVAFELLNEVTDRDYCDRWNLIADACIRRIRVIAPRVKILVGGYWNNSIEALKDLKPPFDENIIYNFHCYEPLIFTHQGAPWIPTMDTSFRISINSTYAELKEANTRMMSQVAVSYDAFDPDKSLGTEYFEKYFSEAVRIAEERNVPLYCGEYGVINRAEPEEIVKWYELIGTTFDKYNIGRAAWSYRAMDFGFVDDHMAGVLDKVIKYL